MTQINIRFPEREPELFFKRLIVTDVAHKSYVNFKTTIPIIIIIRIIKNINPVISDIPN